MMRRALTAALLSVPWVAGCGHPAPVRPAVTMTFCGNDPQPAPAVVEVVCNTDDITARDLAWASWGKPTATASGVAVIDLCAYEDCHTGAFSTVPIRLIASKITTCAGKQGYAVLRYVFADGSPWAGLPANLNTSHYIAGPDRPLPPADQTVALSCG
jgi:hypothetical protein